MILSKKAYTNDLMPAWFPVCICAVALSPRRTVVGAGLLGALGTLALIEPSLWFRWFDRQDLAAILHESPMLGGSGGSHLHVFVFLVCEGMLIGSYLWYAVGIWKLYRADESVDGPAPIAPLAATQFS